MVENLECIQKIVDIPDESWFHMIHIEMEAHAAQAIPGCISATQAIDDGDKSSVEKALSQIPASLAKMASTFGCMNEQCKPETYYHTVRPYLFGFDDIIYKVEEYEEKPRTFRGETGAQSSVIPAVKEFLGLVHERGGLSEHLEIMKAYMPKPHHEFLATIDNQKIRRHVVSRNDNTLKDKFNKGLALEELNEIGN